MQNAREEPCSQDVNFAISKTFTQVNMHLVHKTIDKYGRKGKSKAETLLGAYPGSLAFDLDIERSLGSPNFVRLLRVY